MKLEEINFPVQKVQEYFNSNSRLLDYFPSAPICTVGRTKHYCVYKSWMRAFACLFCGEIWPTETLSSNTSSAWLRM